MKNKPTIAVDIDEVLARYAESFVDFSNERWGTNLKPEDWDEHWSQLWGIDDHETDQRAQEVYKSDVFRRPAKIDDAELVLKKLSERYRLVIVTSRHRAVTKDTLDWIEQHFGSLFEEVHFAGIWDSIEKGIDERMKMTKSEICRQIGADYLIDDNPKHCIAAAEVGIKAVLFNRIPWKQPETVRPDVVQVKNWQDVLEFFENEK